MVKMSVKSVLESLHKKMNTLGITVKEMSQGNIVRYDFYVGTREIGDIQLSESTEMVEHLSTDEIPVIRLRNIYINEECRGKGYSKLMIIYGIYTFREKFPDIQYSALDDDSDAALTPSKNLYWNFGYVLRDTPTLTLPDCIPAIQSELLLDFKSKRMLEFIAILNPVF
jgi:hypothetical protein